MFNSSDITLYVPCFNAQATIEACLNGVTSQTLRPAQVLLVDDGSGTPLALPGRRVIRHAVNRGLGAARNTALRACQTALLAAIDADIAPEPDWLAQLLKALNRENAAGAGGRVEEHCQDTLADRWRAVHMAQHWGAKPIVNPRFLYGANTLLVADEIRACGEYDCTLRTNNEDRVLSEALYARGRSLVYEPAAVCRHLRRDSCRTILRGYWQWHHTKGLARGDFDSPAGLLRRIAEVNFGIFRYRFDMDRAAGREEFLGLDAAIPWIFCALDLNFFARRNNFATPILCPDQRVFKIDENAMAALVVLLEGWSSNSGQALDCLPWHADYLAEFRRNLKESGWLRDCGVGLPSWVLLRNNG